MGLTECESVTNSHGCCFSFKFKLPNLKSRQMEYCPLMQPLKHKSATGFSLITSKKYFPKRFRYKYRNPSTQILESNRKCLNLEATHNLILVEQPGLRDFVGNGWFWELKRSWKRALSLWCLVLVISSVQRTVQSWVAYGRFKPQVRCDSETLGFVGHWKFWKLNCVNRFTNGIEMEIKQCCLYWRLESMSSLSLSRFKNILVCFGGYFSYPHQLK